MPLVWTLIVQSNVYKGKIRLSGFAVKLGRRLSLATAVTPLSMHTIIIYCSVNQRISTKLFKVHLHMFLIKPIAGINRTLLPWKPTLVI